MPVPINSLQDLLTIRELKNQANPTYSAIKALSDGVALGISEQQERAKLKKQQEEKIANSLNMINSFGNTSSMKIKKTINEDGELKLSIEERDLDKERIDQERAKMQQDSEERRQVNDLGRNFKMDNPEDIKIAGRLGLDVNKLLEQGKAVRNEDGSIYVYDRTSRNRIEEQKTIPADVQKAITEFKDSKVILTDAVNMYKGMNLNEVKSNWNVVQQLMNPVGPLSIQAKSNLIKQISNPQLAVLADKLERVFQKYRTSVTGAQASDLELQRLRPLISNLAESPETFMLNADQLLRELDNSVNNRLDMATVAGRDPSVIKGVSDFYYNTNSATQPNSNIDLGTIEVQKTKSGNIYRKIQ